MENDAPDTNVSPRAATRISGSLLFPSTIFVSAFLLFQVQPLISKAILPWFGGSPAVWTTCMLFFQLVLLLGYAYAHVVTHRVSPRTALLWHLGLLAVALFFLPIVPGDRWKPDPAASPALQILLLLAATVGVPYFLLSTTGPLVQAWYHRWSGGASPYRLYALSNIGSLGALLSYPFVVEPAMGTVVQGWSWSAGFLVFAGLCAASAVVSQGKPREDAVVKPQQDSAGATSVEPNASGSFSRWRILLWFGLPTLASVMLLASTSHISQDIAVFPFLWILPLSLYLLSFIICFDHSRWYRPVLMSTLLVVLVAGIAAVAHDTQVNDWLDRFKQWAPLPQWFESRLVVPDVLDNLWTEVFLYAGAMFALCMLCHGEVVRWKPPARHLTSFYLAIAAGGAAGGVLTALIFPRVFDNYWELPFGWMVGLLLALAVIALEAYRQRWLWLRLPIGVWGVLLAIGMCGIVPGLWLETSEQRVDARRNFFGVLRVYEYDKGDPDAHRYSLYNGRILHGLQMQSGDRRLEPTTYFTEDSGVGVAITALQGTGPLRVGTIGLGAGTTAAYGEENDHYTFYEINPAVVELNRRWFTFLSDMEKRGGKVDVRLGDARLTMEREPPQHYHVLAIDAFTGDAIPAHLLTLEAFKVYLRHLRPDGVIAVHISNRHLDLNPVVAAAADAYQLKMLHVESEEHDPTADAASEWLLLTRDQDFCDLVAGLDAGTPVDVSRAEKIAWTDDYSSLWGILHKKPWQRLFDVVTGRREEDDPREEMEPAE